MIVWGIRATIRGCRAAVLENRARGSLKVMTGVQGVLRTPPDDAWGLHRLDPGPELAPYAVWHWIVVWDLRGREPHHQTTLPHPSAHLVVEDGAAWLYGPLRERFERTLAGAGRAVGLRFKPGGVRPLLQAPVSSIRDRRVPASTLPGLDGEALTRAVTAAERRRGRGGGDGGGPDPAAARRASTPTSSWPTAR